MPFSLFASRFRARAAEPAFLGGEGDVAFGKLHELYEGYLAQLAAGIPKGSTVVLVGEQDAASAAALLALGQHACVVVPVIEGEDLATCVARTGAAYIARTAGHALSLERAAGTAPAPSLFGALKGRAGLVIFTSGSTGEPKAVLHDFETLLETFSAKQGKANGPRVAAFNRFDKIAGLYMLLNCLATGAALVRLPSRQPEAVAEAIAAHRVQVLPSSPSFLALFLLSGAWKSRDLSSLELINYGSEPMAEHTLRGLREALPHVTLRQVFGTSELGLVKTRSEGSDSLWFTSNDPRVSLRVVEGRFQIKGPVSMLGYLGQEAGAREDACGWIETGDLAEERSGWIRILGRQAEVMKVGGNLVYPIEVESAIRGLSNVKSVAVSGEENVIFGQIVRATICLREREPEEAFRQRLWDHCAARLEKHKIPQRVVLVEEESYTGDFKTKRRPGP